MKKIILMLVLILTVFSTVKSQISPGKVLGDLVYKKNKKMAYDGSSKVLFFYEDLLQISVDMKEKKKQKRKLKNEEIVKSNSNRLLCLENNFSYPYDIDYPSNFNPKQDSIEYRYVVVMTSNSGGAPMMNANGAMMGGGGLASYTIRVIDVWTKQRMKITRQLGSFDFCSMVKSVLTKFKNNAEN